MKRWKRMRMEIDERLSHPPYSTIETPTLRIRRDYWTPEGATYVLRGRDAFMGPKTFRAFAVQFSGWVPRKLLGP
jgi:hypothetical protein